MKKEDLMYYLAYFMLFILIGIWMMLWAVGLIEFIEAILLWLISMGLLMIVFGTVKTKRKPRGEGTLLMGGMIVSIISLILLALVTDAVDVWIAVALAVILISIGGLGLFMSRIKGIIED